MRKAGRWYVAVAVAAFAVAGAGLTGCSQDRWCEYDATDAKVADSYCQNGTPGYEWEPDSDHGSKSKRKTTKKPAGKKTSGSTGKTSTKSGTKRK